MSLHTLVWNTHGGKFVTSLSRYASEKLWVDNEAYCGFFAVGHWYIPHRWGCNWWNELMCRVAPPALWASPVVFTSESISVHLEGNTKAAELILLAHGTYILLSDVWKLFYFKQTTFLTSYVPSLTTFSCWCSSVQPLNSMMSALSRVAWKK